MTNAKLLRPCSPLLCHSSFGIRCSYLLQCHDVLTAQFFELHVHAFTHRGGYILADEICLDRKFTMAAVVEHIECGARGSAAEEHVIHKNHGLARNIKGNLCGMNVRRELVANVIA